MRYRNRIKIAPGLHVNLSRSGLSVSAGPRGLSSTVGRQGVGLNYGIPGSGLYDRKRLGKKKRRQKARQASSGGTINVGVTVSVTDEGTLQFTDGEDGPTLPEDLIKLVKEQKRDEMRGQLQSVSDEDNAMREAILRIHEHSPAPDSIKPSPRSFSEAEPLVPTFEAKPGFLHRLFFRAKTRDLDQRNAEKQKIYDDAMAIWEAHKSDFLKAEGKRIEEVRYGIDQDADIITQYFGDYLSDLDWPLETTIDFDLGEDITTLSLDVDLPEVEDIPQTESKVHASQYKIIRKKLTQKQIRLDYAKHIHSILFRIISEVFASLPSVETVTCSGYTQRKEGTNTKIQDVYILSVSVLKTDWKEIDFKHIDQADPVALVEQTELRRKMTTTGVFKKIVPHG